MVLTNVVLSAVKRRRERAVRHLTSTWGDQRLAEQLSFFAESVAKLHARLYYKDLIDLLTAFEIEVIFAAAAITWRGLPKTWVEFAYGVAIGLVVCVLFFAIQRTALAASRSGIVKREWEIVRRQLADGGPAGMAARNAIAYDPWLRRLYTATEHWFEAYPWSLAWFGW